jgi:Family of unknown function (DUF6308)
MDRSPTWWRPWWEALSSDNELVAALKTIRRAATVEAMSLLRVADIALWMSSADSDDLEIRQPDDVFSEGP